MNLTRTLLSARTPSIKFLGKRTPPKSTDHTPHPHPASPSHALPDSFAAYRSKAQQHGPLGASATRASSSTASYARGEIGGHSGRQLGSVEPPEGQYFDRSELPGRFTRTKWSVEEIEAIETGGASMWG
ncbi:hypothetical protein MMC20_005506 [Loxospora ochrophaea]|nr:hypothetical protein [Loxospora ochrophaea]